MHDTKKEISTAFSSPKIYSLPLKITDRFEKNHNKIYPRKYKPENIQPKLLLSFSNNNNNFGPNKTRNKKENFKEEEVKYDLMSSIDNPKRRRSYSSVVRLSYSSSIYKKETATSETKNNYLANTKNIESINKNDNLKLLLIKIISRKKKIFTLMKINK